MPRIAYAEIRMQDKSLEVVAKAEQVIQEYAGQGLTLTLRQLYYQFVSRGWLANTERSYKKLGATIADARLCGMIDWEAIIDRTRFVRTLSHWANPAEIVGSCAEQFRLDKWLDQRWYVEVWIEKDALLGVIEGVCAKWDVPYMACRGYASASEIWRAGHGRLRGALDRGKDCTVFYLGDHDPSGLDMSRDLQARLDLFTNHPGGVEVKRLALNMDQIRQYDPPPNPTKMSDSRADWYCSEYGDECWELDALDPAVITRLVESEIKKKVNLKQWKRDLAIEQAGRADLGLVANSWDRAVKLLR